MIDIVLGWDWNLIAQILDRRRSRLYEGTAKFKDNKKTKWLGLNLIQIWIVILN